jgi:biopolymer transport protein ExbD
MIEFSTQRRPLRELPLTAMIDVVFILIFFFMLTTSFARIESMELMLPAASKVAVTKQQISKITILNDGRILFGKRDVDLQEMRATLSGVFRDSPTQAVVVFADDEVSMQRMVTVLDEVSMAGGQSIYVRALPNAASVQP